MSQAISQTESLNDDCPLLDCLTYVLASHDLNVAKSAVIAGLPLVNNQLTPQLCVRAAKKQQFHAQIIKKPLMAINTVVLPIILLLDNDKACVLTHIEGDFAHIRYGAADDTDSVESLDELKKNYTGLAIYIKPRAIFDKRTKEHTGTKRVSWFWATVFQFKTNFLQIGLASLLINALALASPLFVMNVYDRVIPNNAIETLWALSIGIIVVFLFDLIIKQLRFFLLDITGRKIDVQLARFLMQKVLSLKGEARPTSVGAFLNEINGYESIREFFTSATLTVLFDLPFIFLFLWLVSYIGGPLVYVPLLAIPVVLIVALLLELPMRAQIQKSHLGNIQKQAILTESLLSLESIKSLNAEGKTQGIWEKNVNLVSRATMKSRFFSSLIVNFTAYVIQMVTVITVIGGVYLIQDTQASAHPLTMGALIACSILNARVLAPLSQIAGIISRFQQSRLGLKNLNRIMNLPSEHDVDKDKIQHATIKGDIQFDKVSFAYPEQVHKALIDVNFTIKAGEKVAIIGRIGSGKSSILRLILSLYSVEKGHVFIDGIDKEQLDCAKLRAAVAYVSQDAPLFYGSLKDNIKIARPSGSDDDLLLAAKRAGVDEFARSHPKGYEMLIEERGENLSTGQRQAICIARALYGQAAIFLLDEPTSAMDSQSEARFISQLAQMASNSTLLLVTHKRAMLQLVDRIIILDKGRVVNDGPRDSVLAALAKDKVQVKKDAQ